ncbi:hypothetical protein U73_00502 [Staphylococcus aureus M1198]|uniref:hypothetical protein n=8 Tax=Staphylococcus aureus TaxID=1280 RepID=UPI0002C9F2CF|nr:hypothetical protein [Staphylococcus aureus]ENN56269.1 hypothetical protein U73_00502 [Staphylococcus aureus M1198]
MTNPTRTKRCGGDVLCGIDNHFQLLLYISENHCQLETKTFFEYFLRIVNKTHDYAILELEYLKVMRFKNYIVYILLLNLYIMKCYFQVQNRTLK